MEKCIEFYEKEFLKECNDIKNKWTNMSCIYSTNNGKFMKIIAMGIGTTCVGEDRYDNQGYIKVVKTLIGKTIHDSHSEVLVRRGLMRFLYDCVKRVLIEKKECEYFDINNENLLVLKCGIDFHLITSRPPCIFGFML